MGREVYGRREKGKSRAGTGAGTDSDSNWKTSHHCVIFALEKVQRREPLSKVTEL